MRQSYVLYTWQPGCIMPLSNCWFSVYLSHENLIISKNETAVTIRDYKGLLLLALYFEFKKSSRHFSILFLNFPSQNHINIENKHRFTIK